MLLAGLDEHADAPLLVLGHAGTVTRGEVRDRAAAIAKSHATLTGHAVGIRGIASVENVAWLVALDQLGARAVVLPIDGSADDTPGLELAGIVGESTPRARRARDADPGVVLFTSGTTGRPKAARHRWSTLNARVHRGPSVHGARWLLTYPLSAFAGFQVLLHAVLGRGTLCVPAGGDPSRQLMAAAAAGVTHLSGTPTFFRFALAMGPRLAKQWSPRQITLGGEPVDQAILDQLHARFPRARITHIYASTELGPCFSVHDRRAGFPASYLERDDLPVWITIRDDELWARSPHAMEGYVQGGLDTRELVPTGDRVRVEDDRVLFLGRNGERLSVGGTKVDPAEVEQVLLRVPGVAAVRVSGQPSPLVGQLVRAEIVPRPGTEAHALRDAVVAFSRDHLDRVKRPRVVQIVDRIEQTPSGKIARPGPEEAPCPSSS